MHVVLAVGASSVTGQLIAGAVPVPLNAVSVIANPSTITLPLLLTSNA